MTMAKKFLSIALLVLCGVFAFSGISEMLTVKAETAETEEFSESEIVRGLATNLSLAIGGGDNEVWADVKNEFTLFPSTIWVFVELYSSETYQESYTTMTLEGRNSIKDLDMGKTIKVTVPTGGEQKYWQARMRYKFDDRDWIEKTTPTFLYSADGTLLD